jgi:citrate lyase subunit gamma (acyl carrier protein)
LRGIKGKDPASKEETMEIKKPAVAGTMESSDCQVTVEPGEGKIDFTLDSAVAHQFGNQIKKVTLETLANLGVNNVKISIVDKGALDCTIKARIEGAVFRSVDQYKDLPWGGAIR